MTFLTMTEISLGSILRDTYYQSFVPVLNDLRDKYYPQEEGSPAPTEMATEEMMSFTIGMLMGLITQFGRKFVDDLQMKTDILQSHVTAGTKVGDIPEKDFFQQDMLFMAMAGINNENMTSIGCDELFPLYASFNVLALCVWDIGQLPTL